jgi:hypothetical protein
MDMCSMDTQHGHTARAWERKRACSMGIGMHSVSPIKENRKALIKCNKFLMKTKASKCCRIRFKVLGL